MNLDSLNNKKIAILGLGLENQALVKYLLKHKIKCEITICDARKDIKRKDKGFWISCPSGRRAAFAGTTNIRVRWQLGSNFDRDLEKFDILFRSPGWPIDCLGIEKALKAGAQLSSPIKLFFDSCPSRNIIGVTGTKGKGTTASLIYEILRRAGKPAYRTGGRVWLGGNIGLAPFEFLDKIRKNDWLVLELSSFQLEDMTESPKIAVITNFYPEHLAPADPNNPNYHKTLKDYWKAKWNIARWQNKNEFSIFNFSSFAKASKDKQFSNNFQFSNFQTKSKIICFKKSELPSKLVGEHNKENVAAAVAVAEIVGVEPEVVKKAVASFKGLPHRLELVGELAGVKYYDDSFATTPEAAILALKSFSQPIILLLGGADKKADFKKLAQEVKNRAKFVVLLAGQATLRIKKELLAVGISEDQMKLVYNIKAAVKAAKAKASRGEIVLLSTACASFGMFKNYKERGDLFKQEVLMDLSC